MAIATFFSKSERKEPFALYLSTPLYFAITIISLAALILLIFSGDGYDYGQDDLILFPIIALFFSLMTGPVRCFFWVCSFCVRVRFVKENDADEGRIRLGDEDSYNQKRPMFNLEIAGKILLSWNTWVAAALIASLGVLIWRFVENAKGRALTPQAGWAVALLDVACVLHILLANPGYGDRKFIMLFYPFEEEYQMSRENEEAGA
ncbi:hypothetical protein ACLMJK_008125 [Lecanora helva]